jgi:hypothetical protein
MLNAYNLIAPFYDRLVRIFYGNSLLKVQQILIKSLPAEGSLLILGGGTGQILEKLYENSPKLYITYLEASSAMIDFAKSNSPIGQHITYIHSDQLVIEAVKIDYIFAAFFWDTFRSREIVYHIEKLNQHYNNPLWLIADFQIKPSVERPVLTTLKLKLSIIFFKLVAKHTPNDLPPIFDLYLKLGLR